MAAQAQPPVEPDVDERGIERAVEIAWRALSRRERTVAELRAFLERRSVPAEAIHAATAELAAAGYLDDAAYARRFTEDRRQLDRWGSERIARDLSRRGVAEEHVAAALADQDGGERERAAARALLSERFPEPPADDPARDRAWRLLVRRGYAPQLAYEAVRAHARAPREPPPVGHGPTVARRGPRE